jgi:hypothetical protein
MNSTTHAGAVAGTGTQQRETGEWRDLADPRRALVVDDLEAGLKEPEFENLELPEPLGPVTEVVDDHKIKRFAFTQDDYNPWCLHESTFGGRTGHAVDRDVNAWTYPAFRRYAAR